MALVVEYDKAELCSHEYAVVAEVNVKYATAYGEACVFDFGQIYGLAVVVEQVDIAVGVCDKEVALVFVIGDFAYGVALGELVEYIVGVALVVVVGKREERSAGEKICLVGSLDDIGECVAHRRKQGPPPLFLLSEKRGEGGKNSQQGKELSDHEIIAWKRDIDIYTARAQRGRDG